MNKTYLRISTICLFASLLISGIASAQPFCKWTQQGLSGTQYEEAKGVARDASGNIYVIGGFYSASVKFGSFTLTNTDLSGTSSDVFIVKYDSCGTVLWAKKAGSMYTDDFGVSVAVDKAGNLYASGTFYSSTIKFGSVTLTNSGASNTFLVKYNPAGNVVWAKNSGGNSNAYLVDMTTDNNCNILMSGTCTYDSLRFGSIVIKNSGSYETFAVKYDSTGTALWAKGAGNHLSSSYGYGVATDGSNNVFVCGSFQDSITFGSIKLTGSSNNNLFVTKYNASGNAIWAKTATGDYEQDAQAITVDPSGNVSISGFFSSTMLDFGGSVSISTSGSRGNSFLAQYDGSGTIKWARATGGEYYDQSVSLASDAAGNLYMAGRFQSDSVTFGSLVLYNSVSLYDSTNDIYLAKYNSSGKAIWAKSAGGFRDDYPEKVIVDNNGNPYLVGEFISASIDFGATTLTNGGDFDAFITNNITQNGMQTPSLCMVTVDSLSQHNVIYWDKTMYPTAKNFIVYRETNTNDFQPIVSLPYDSLSLFIDTVKTKYITYTGDPNVSSNRYKLQYQDSAGNYSGLSPFHNTIFVTDDGAGNFTWTPYTIEGMSSGPVTSYVLYREDSTGTGSKPLYSIGGNQHQLSDPGYASYKKGHWRVITQWSLSCTPMLVQHTGKGDETMAVAITKSVSNIRNNLAVSGTGISSPDMDKLISVYPNPATSTVTIEYPEALSNDHLVVTLRNYLGATVDQSIQSKGSVKSNIDLSGLASGVYSIQLKSDSYQSTKRIVIK